MEKNYTFLLLVIIILMSKPTKAQINVQDSLALVALYNSTDGPHWKRNDNWLTSAPVSSWHGIEVSQDRVLKVILRHNYLTGNIPPELGQLTALVYLDLGSNELSGNIPGELGNLASVTDLYLDHNQL